MTIHIAPPDKPELDDSFALWRSQYPKYGALIDEGAPPLTTRRLDDAACVLTKAVSLAPNEPVILGELGSLLRAGGRKAEAMHYLSASLKLDPEQTLVWLTLAGLCNEIGDKTSAEQAFRAALELDSASAEAACRTAFQALCGYGRKEAAIRLGHALLERVPDDPIIGYHLDALRGHAYERAPCTYLKASFDKYAPDFDRHLVEVLDYRLPDKLHPLLVETGKTFTRILDLGCGTGLSAPHLASFGGHLTGVDISPRMLDKARERNLYDRLIEDERSSISRNGKNISI
jgi:predicted TPR repeat methyltransferase